MIPNISQVLFHFFVDELNDKDEEASTMIDNQTSTIVFVLTKSMNELHLKTIRFHHDNESHHENNPI